MKKFENSYKPLTDNLTIKESKVNGLGLFAKEDIPINYEFGITHHWLGEECIRTPLGGFINHSDNPNCIIKEGLTQRTLYSIRKISEGEEILVQYTLY